MKTFAGVNDKITYSERHLNAVKNEVEKLNKASVKIGVSSHEFNNRFGNINKHLKEIAKELYLIREALATFDELLPEYGDASDKFKGLITRFKALKQDSDSLKSGEPKKEQKTHSSTKKKETLQQKAPVQIESKGITAKPIDYKKDIPKKTPPSKAENHGTEGFIGTKVISIVGILLMMLGIGYGAKYAIENDLIKPSTWITAIYILGTALLVTAIKLKNKYENFSAVLLSGAMAIYYFTTYFAFAYYNLISREVAFGMMLVFTVFTVLAALRYDNQIIAHIGFVGAYGVPFLVRENNENVVALFSFMAIINVGILSVAIKKYWQSLFYAAFFLTWIIFGTWFMSSMVRNFDFNTAMLFSSIFFVIFYATILAYKLIHGKIFDAGDVVLLLFNTVFVYVIGLTALNRNVATQDYLGLYTVLNGVLYLLMNFVIKSFKSSDKNMHYLTFGLALAFITIAIPVEFNGSWLALFWLVESAVLFWIGRMKKVRFYEIFSYPLLGVAIISLMFGWTQHYGFTANIKLFQSVDFLISMLFIAILVVMLVIEQKTKENAFNGYRGMLVATLLSVFYFAFFLEINVYWKQQIGNEQYIVGWLIQKSANYRAIEAFRSIWLINYTLFYLVLISWANIKLYKNEIFAGINLIINATTIFIFLTIGLYNLSFTKDFGDFGAQYLLRYSSIGILAFLLITTQQYLKQTFVQFNLSVGFSIAMHIVFLWVLTSELFNWMHLMHVRSVYKLGLSLLWSIYGFGLVIFGIWKRLKHLRIMAFLLFGLTIVKLFFYDIAHLSTLSKTIVMMSLGAVLLIVSFLYNKFIGKAIKEE